MVTTSTIVSSIQKTSFIIDKNNSTTTSATSIFDSSAS